MCGGGGGLLCFALPLFKNLFFQIFLPQLDVTKTKDNKSTFLHVLADAVYTRFPTVLTVFEELPTVMSAGKGRVLFPLNIVTM